MEKKLESKDNPPRYHFQLYIAENEPNSQKALEVIKRVGEKYLRGRYTMEVIDVLKHYRSALANNILLAPTLIIKSPPPEIKIVGSLHNIRKLLEILGLPEAGEDL